MGRADEARQAPHGPAADHGLERRRQLLRGDREGECERVQADTESVGRGQGRAGNFDK